METVRKNKEWLINACYNLHTKNFMMIHVNTENEIINKYDKKFRLKSCLLVSDRTCKKQAIRRKIIFYSITLDNTFITKI